MLRLVHVIQVNTWHAGECSTGRKMARLCETECVFVAFGIQHGMCVIQLSVACLQHFLRSKRHDFERKKKKVIEHKMCVLISSTTFV